MRRDLLLIPNDSLKSENFSGNGVDTVVGVTVRWTPVLGKPTARRVVNNFHCPTKLSENAQVVQSGHIRMCPCVYSNVIWCDKKKSVNGRSKRIL